MVSNPFNARKPIPNRRSLSVVAVSGDELRGPLIDALIADEEDYGPIFLESFARAHSRIRQVTPDVVVIFSEVDDPAAYQLLSMLKMDDDLSGILIVTCVGTNADSATDDMLPQFPDDPPRRTHALQMN